MNVDKAIAHLNAKAGNKSQGACAKFIREAIQAGGVNLKPPYPTNAKDYGSYLDQYGFTKIAADNYAPHKGDVVVIQPYSGGNSSGHIQMYNGTGWVSDFIQTRTFWPGPGYQKNKPSYAIYRP